MALFGLWKKEEPPKEPIRKRYYAGAGKNRLLSDFFDSGRSADSELRPALKTLRDRSRELSRNNEFVKRYLNLLKTNVVGERGFGLQVKAMIAGNRLDQNGNEQIEMSWRKWGRRCTVDGRSSWWDAQRMAIEGVARDGEVFIKLHRSAKYRDSFAIEFIEPDQIDEQKNERLPNGNQIRMGVEIDPYRKPVAYWMLTAHPGDYDYTSQAQKLKHKRISAEEIIHVYMILRPGQTRGEPWLSPVMPSMKQLGGFREASVINARIGASKMGIITTPTGDGYISDDMDGDTPVMDVEPGTIQQLAVGQDFKTFDPAYPNSEFRDFNKSVLQGIASALGVSYASLSGDLESTSYSSIRQGALEERDYYRDLQQFLLDHFVWPIYGQWLSAAMEVQESMTLPVSKYERFYDSSYFRGKAWQWVDPLKEMNASIVGLKHGVLSIQDVAAQYGKDVEELMAQIARDKTLASEFGIQYALEPYGAEKATETVSDNSEDE